MDLRLSCNNPSTCGNVILAYAITAVALIQLVLLERPEQTPTSIINGYLAIHQACIIRAERK